MNYSAFSLPHLTRISHHGFVTLYENKETEEKALHANVNFKSADVFATFEASEILHAPNKYTVQVSETTHIILQPEILQYINHSCNPNVFFNTSTFELSALKDIARGDELTFFYPSTEWLMESPFKCFCQSDKCLHDIRGAFFLAPEIIQQYKFTDFILQKINSSHLQKV
ncbi:MAG: SET domain-containing protein-lysine N-methyltransferase [Bacteroidota bacterium]|nr:SET domain-containing protein-lysine N-methyltransferase [Bacteroidota bacterium]